jgi:hypothetical protein
MTDAVQLFFQILSLICGICVTILAIRALIYGGPWGYIIINAYVLFFGLVLVVKEMFFDKILDWCRIGTLYHIVKLCFVGCINLIPLDL